MGFRFHRRVKLIPGLRLNLGKRGASLSLGRTGSWLNLSSRGARATLGIPGTGLFWSQDLSQTRPPPRGRSPGSRDGPPPRGASINSLEHLDEVERDPTSTVIYGHSGRRLSDIQLNAFRRELEESERRQAALRAIDATEAELESTLNCWRDVPSLPTETEYQAALTERSFEFGEQPPPSPELDNEKQRLREACALDVVRRRPRPWLDHLLGWTLGLVAGSICLIVPAIRELPEALMWCNAAAAALLGVWLADTVTKRSWRRLVARLTAEATEAAWPERERQVRDTHAEETAEFHRRFDEGQDAWEQSEAGRIDWVTRLLRGDLEQTEKSIADTLCDIDFPFETECDVAVDEHGIAFLHLDLPEIQDVIPEHRQKVLKDGRIQHVKRKKRDRCDDYAALTTGLALMLSHAAFVAAPALERLTLAAYTQRKRRGTSLVEDQYVFDFEATRARIRAMDFPNLIPITTVAMLPGRLEQKTNLDFKKLPAPPWVQDLGSD